MYYLRMWKIESEWPLTSAYVLYLYESYRLHILEKDLVNFSKLGSLEDSKVYHHQYWKKVLVLVDFQDIAIMV